MNKATSPKPKAEDELTPEEEAKLLRVIERRAERKLAADREAVGLRGETALLRCVAEAPVPALQRCSARHPGAAFDGLRCDGHHPSLSADVLVSPGECTREFGGHFARDLGPSWAEIEDDGSTPTLEDLLVTLPPFQAAIRTAEARLQSDDAMLESLRGQIAVIESEIARRQALRCRAAAD